MNLKAGDRVKFTSGYHEGRFGTIDSIVRRDVPGYPDATYLIFVDEQFHNDGTPLIHATSTISFEKVEK